MDPGQSLNSEEVLLWRRFKSGDRRAFALIYETYVGTLYRYGYHLVPDPVLVQDAVQDLFTNLWLTRERLSDTSSVKYYLFRSLRRQIRRLYRNTQGYESLGDNHLARVLNYTASAEEVRIENETEGERIKVLQKALAHLPERQLEAIRLRFFEDFDLEEVAEIMQINTQSVRNLIQRSIQKLGRSFEILSVVLTVYGSL